MKARMTYLLIACLGASGAGAATRHDAPSGRPAVKDVSASTNHGRKIQVVATAYSWRESSHRRWGSKNRIGSRLDRCQEGLEHVAVDPSVIPLGSIIDVPGAGRRIASDTGGGVRGNRIDLHWPTIAAMREWGKRRLTITVVRWGWG